MLTEEPDDDDFVEDLEEPEADDEGGDSWLDNVDDSMKSVKSCSHGATQ